MRLKLVAIVLLSFSLFACSPVTSAITSAIKPSGANVLANGQAGAINSQTVGKSVSAPILRPQVERDIIQSELETGVKAEAIDTVTVHNTTDPKVVFILLLLFIAWSYLLWRLPSPDQIQWKRAPP